MLARARAVLLLCILLLGSLFLTTLAAARSGPAPTKTTFRTAQTAHVFPPELEAQRAAMLPSSAGDLLQANAWDRYTIIAALNPGGPGLSGTVTVDMVNRSSKPLSEIYFHLYPNHPAFGGRLDVASATVDGVAVSSKTANSDTLLRLKPAQPIAAGANARVVLGFKTRSLRNASDQYLGLNNMEAGLWSMADFYPVLARYSDESGWDTRSIVSNGDFTVTSTALYDVTIDAPDSWSLIGSGVSISNVAVNDEVQRVRFVSGPQREFFLAAFQGLEQASSVVDGTRVVTYFQSRNPEAGQRSLKAAEQALHAFNARFGPYPLAELEVVQAALTQYYGMEYPGIVLIEQDLYRQSGTALETTIAHEIGHQWWYSLVGNDAQGEAWLDEGMASYAQIVYWEALGEDAQAVRELQNFRNIYKSLRERGGDRPMASSPAVLSRSYFPIAYGKAPLFFQALRNRLGDEMFYAFLLNYYTDNRYHDVVGADLLAAAEKTCACELDSFYRDWVTTAARVPIP